ncbi:MAG: hypothetical protein LKF30_00220 [Sphingobium sp.]|jgi:hypothetical protein|nr:hypothetical protein [Sphingobium sp.]MCI1754978.1 hypothetical protein [Sphingobium sp.]MCI2051723.1 hypothetical protein [Sphingobium sp.]
MKPFSLSVAWLETLAFVKREGGLVFPVVLLFIAIPLALIMHVIPDDMRQMTPGAGAPNVSLPPYAMVVIPFALFFVLGGTLSCYALALKPGISLREALFLGFRRIPHAFSASVLIGVALAIPMLLVGSLSPAIASLYITGATIFFSVKFLFLNAVIVDRMAGPIAAIRQSWVMARGNAARLLLLIVAMTIPIMLAQVTAGILFGLIGFAVGGAEAGRQISDFAGAVMLSLGQLFIIVVTTRLYRQHALG